MNAIDVLMQDHRLVEKQLAEFQTATSARRQEIFQQVSSSLTAHALAEEQAFYRALAPYATEAVERAIEEHAAVTVLLEQLRQTDIDSDDFPRLFAELAKNVQAHMREEEEPGGLFDIARQCLNESLRSQLGERITMIMARWSRPSAA